MNWSVSCWENEIAMKPSYELNICLMGPLFLLRLSIFYHHSSWCVFHLSTWLRDFLIPDLINQYLQCVATAEKEERWDVRNMPIFQLYCILPPHWPVQFVNNNNNPWPDLHSPSRLLSSVLLTHRISRRRSPPTTIRIIPEITNFLIRITIPRTTTSFCLLFHSTGNLVPSNFPIKIHFQSLAISGYSQTQKLSPVSMPSISTTTCCALHPIIRVLPLLLTLPSLESVVVASLAVLVVHPHSTTYDSSS